MVKPQDFLSNYFVIKKICRKYDHENVIIKLLKNYDHKNVTIFEIEKK